MSKRSVKGGTKSNSSYTDPARAPSGLALPNIGSQNAVFLAGFRKLPAGKAVKEPKRPKLDSQYFKPTRRSALLEGCCPSPEKPRRGCVDWVSLSAPGRTKSVCEQGAAQIGQAVK